MPEERKLFLLKVPSGDDGVKHEVHLILYMDEQRKEVGREEKREREKKGGKKRERVSQKERERRLGHSSKAQS